MNSRVEAGLGLPAFLTTRIATRDQAGLCRARPSYLSQVVAVARRGSDFGNKGGTVDEGVG